MKPWRLCPGTVIVATALGLTGCVSGSGGSPPSTSNLLQPARIEAFFAPTDSLDPITATSPSSVLLAFNVYDPLAVMAKKGAALSLTKSIEPNATADEWIVTLRGGLTYSDGTAVTGQDILDSPSHSAQSPSYATLYSGIDFEASSASGSTVTLKLKGPASDLPEPSLGVFSAITPGGKFTGIGAGPFVVGKGGPNTGYQPHANGKYWDGTPSIPQVAMVPVPDSTTQANALRTGEIDLATSLNSAVLTTLFGAPNVKMADTILESASALELALNTRVVLFSDLEVWRAAKLVVDRDKLINTVLGSTDEVTNDMFGKGYGNYLEDVAQTVANKEGAGRIFAKKGATSLAIVVVDIMPGMVSSAELMAQESVEMGVQVTVDKRDPQTYYSNLEELYQAQAATALWISRSPITEFRSQVTPDYPFSLSGSAPETIQQNPAKTTATLDTVEQKKLVDRINREIHDQDGDLTWSYQK